MSSETYHKTQPAISSWLEWTPRKSSQTDDFEVIDVREIATISSELQEYLAQLLIVARIDPLFLQACAGYLGWERVKTIFLSEAKPTTIPVQRGDFGEVISTAILKELVNYVVPIQKLRYKINKNLSLPGTDILAIKISGERISEVCYVESKFRKDLVKDLAVISYDQLEKDYSQEVPAMLKFVIAQLFDKEIELYAAFMFFLRDRRPNSKAETFRIGILSESEAWSEEILERLAQYLKPRSEKLPKLSVHVILVKNAVEISDKAFEAMGPVQIIEDD